MKKGFSIIGLNNPKDHNNIGSIIRLCGNYDVSMLAISGKRYKRSCTDTMKYYKQFPIIKSDDLISTIPFDCIPIAIDLVEDANSLYDFVHPERAFYIFGQEDGTLGKDILQHCKYKIFIPTFHCMNLSNAVACVLYDRALKRKENYQKKG